MEESAQQRSERYVSARSQHPAWLLLASRRAPLVLGCLRTLFERAHDGIPMEDALQALSKCWLLMPARNFTKSTQMQRISKQVVNFVNGSSGVWS
ncbi:DUF3375 family protein [Pseudomonas aeruginosa]|nr:DUF3375 family protein [Pseudomonas aeruginosa]